MKDFADTTVRVRYAETDQMGVAHHSNHLIWFEAGRVEYCHQLGFEYKQMEIEDDSFIVVAKASCRYKRPARFDDVLTIRTRVTESQRRTIRFAYEIHNQTKELIATGETLHVICDRRGPAEIAARTIHTIFPGKSHEFAASQVAIKNASAEFLRLAHVLRRLNFSRCRFRLCFLRARERGISRNGGPRCI